MKVKVWKMSEKIGSHFEAECYEKNIIGIGWSRVGDLRKYGKNKEKLRKSEKQKPKVEKLEIVDDDETIMTG